MSTVGGFSFKHPLSDICNSFNNIFRIISNIHEFGAEKYGYYSFQNTPYQSNASTLENLDALMRHYLCCTTGALNDEEGMFHIHYIPARAHMYITTWYMEQFKRENAYTKLKKDSVIDACQELQKIYLTNTDFHIDWKPTQISSEALISVGKWKQNKTIHSYKFTNLHNISPMELLDITANIENHELESKLALILQETLMLAFQFSITCDIPKFTLKQLYSDLLLPDFVLLLSGAYCQQYCTNRDIHFTREFLDELLSKKREENKLQGISHTVFDETTGEAISVACTESTCTESNCRL